MKTKSYWYGIEQGVPKESMDEIYRMNPHQRTILFIELQEHAEFNFRMIEAFKMGEKYGASKK